MNKRFLLVFLILSWKGLAAEQEQQKEPLTIAAIDWCPQLCPKETKSGYVLDLVHAIFADSPYEIKVRYYPWSRAIQLTRYGAVHALLSPAKAEAPDLKYPHEEIGVQRMCFFTKYDSNWQYTGVDSLKGLQVGVASDTSLEELNDYMQSHPQQFQFQPYIDRYLKQSIGKLERKRIDTFLFTYATTIHELRKLKAEHRYKAAGCVNTTNIYMAFTAANVDENISAMMRFFDSKMRDMHKSGKVESILGSYQLNTWR